jgi:ABC-type multidrug transport system fused ATPase/permease subunit
VNHWRQHVGLVQQEPLLFAGSLRENIAYGAPHATQTEIEEAARLANCHDFIMEKGKLKSQ